MKLLKILTLLFTFCVLFSSCEKESLTLTDVSEEPRMTKLGKKLKNPFSVANMQQAYKSLLEKNAGARVKDLEIRPTHLYVRYLPPNKALYDSLVNDSTLYLEDYPLDYEVIEQGEYYHDPSIPEGLPTYQYTSVPIYYVPPTGVAFEVLDELYLPKEDTTLEDESGRLSQNVEEWVDMLEYESLLLTDNLSEEEKIETENGRTKGLLPPKYHPNGIVRYVDTRVGVIFLEGVKIRTRRFFEYHEAITDASGNFWAEGTYRYEFYYKIIWERANFDIRSGTFGQANMDGPECKCRWDVSIMDGVQRFYASIFRGAHRYFYGNIDGLRRPKMLTKMKISAYNKNGEKNVDNLGDWDNTGIFPDIRIWRFVDTRERGTDEIFSTTIHEIAHTTHIQLMNGGWVQFIQVSDKIIESWAVAVQWRITSMEYREKGIANYGGPFFTLPNLGRLQFSFQNWNSAMTDAYPYTSLFIDIVDNHNQVGRFNGSAITDNVQGYTLANIESGFLKHVYGFSSLREKLKDNKPFGVTDAQIDELLNQF